MYPNKSLQRRIEILFYRLNLNKKRYRKLYTTG